MQAVAERTLFDRPAEAKTVFEQYDAEHPDIWQEFRDIAMDLILKGRDHYGAKAIFEIIRYHRAIRGGSDFKVNNSFTASYARKFAAEYPEYSTFFEFREKHNESL